jgi:uncharacterized protein
MQSKLDTFQQPLYVMAKPAGAVCNMACKYCYYLEKNKLYANHVRHNMSDDVLENFIRRYIEAQTTDAVQFTWHGGEAMIRPLSFFKRVVELQNKYAAGHAILNSLQTNGTLMSEDWCKFLRDNRWLVGLSIDGPQEFHDEYRRSADGKPTFQRVMRAVNMLNRHNVEWNAMAVVNDYNADFPDEFYNFFKQIDCRYIQFTPIVERLQAHTDGRLLAAPSQTGVQMMPYSVTPQQWGNFLCRVFDLWVREDVGKFFVQIFDATLANWMGVQPGICTMARTCGHAGVMEFNGDVYACDHFVFPEYKLGNIADKTFVEMMYSPEQTAFGEAKATQLSDKCRACKYLFACNGECPKNRFALNPGDDARENYLCAGYRQYFEHVAPYMDFMRTELLAGRAPANVMHADIKPDRE